MICRICREEFYHQTQLDPPEPCLCGEGCTMSLWRWYGTVGGFCRGLKLMARYRIASFCFWLGNGLISGWRDKHGD